MALRGLLRAWLAVAAAGGCAAGVAHGGRGVRAAGTHGAGAPRPSRRVVHRATG